MCNFCGVSFDGNYCFEAVVEELLLQFALELCCALEAEARGSNVSWLFSINFIEHIQKHVRILCINCSIVFSLT